MRRYFRSLTIVLLLASCGSGGGTAGTSNTSTQVAAPVDPTISVTTSSGTTGLSSAGKVSVSSADGNISQNAVVTFGQTFASGSVTEGLQVLLNGNKLPTQVDVKRHHADGSVRHAILSVRLPAASTAVDLKVSPAPISPAATPFPIRDALNSAVDYRVEITEAGVIYAATLKAALRGKVDAWLEGPIAAEWRGRVVPVAGANAHPGLRVIFDARFYSASQGRVSIAIENVEATAARGDRDYNLRILDAQGTEVFAQSGIKHFHQTRLRKLFHFGGAKVLTAVVDAAALQSSRAIPKYTDANIGTSPSAKLYNQWLGQNLNLFGSGIVGSYMPAAGGRIDIGPLPGWTVIALLSRDPRAYTVMFDTAERAAFFSVHYRDAISGDVISINDHPTVTTGNGQYSDVADRLPATNLPRTTPHEADIAHQPSLSYVPYVVSGDRYFLDEVYFWSNWNLISQNFQDRGKQLGLVHNEQLRGQAWALRSFGEAAWIAPDTDWQKDYFADKIKQNIFWLRTNAMPSNPLGMWRGTADWNGSIQLEPYAEMSSQVTHVVAPWMHDFFAFTLAELCDFGFDAKDLRDWSLGFTVKRFTSGATFNRFDGTAYRVAIQLSGNKVIQTMAELTYHTFFNRTGASPTQLPYTNDPAGYGIQALAVLGAAVDAKLPNAADAFLFVRSEILKRNVNQAFADDPTWNLVPRSAVSGLSELPGIYPTVTAVTPPPSAGPAGYTPCAQEGQLCTFSGTAQVAYGASGSFNYRSATNSADCSNATFGDPITGVAKSCFYQTSGTSPTLPTTPSPVTPLPVPIPVNDPPRNSDTSIQSSWFAQLPLKQWVEVPGSRLLDNVAVPTGYNANDLVAVVSAWGGAALDTQRNGLHLFGGGHGDGKWNGILFFSLDTFHWTVTSPGTPISQNTGMVGNYCVDKDQTDSLNADGTPMACHTYNGVTWIAERDELFVGMRHSAVWDLKTGQWRKPILDWKHSTWNNDIQAWAHKGKVYIFCGDKNPLTGALQDGAYGGWIFDPAGSTQNNDGAMAAGSWSAMNVSGTYKCLWNQIAVAMPERGEVFRMRPSDSENLPHVLTLDNLANSYTINPSGKGWEAASKLPWSGGSPPDVSGAAFAPGATRAADRLYILENADNGRLWEINPNDWSGQLLATAGAGPRASLAGNYKRFVFDRKHGVLVAMPAASVNGLPDVPNVKIIRIR